MLCYCILLFLRLFYRLIVFFRSCFFDIRRKKKLINILFILMYFHYLRMKLMMEDFPKTLFHFLSYRMKIIERLILMIMVISVYVVKNALISIQVFDQFIFIEPSRSKNLELESYRIRQENTQSDNFRQECGSFPIEFLSEFHGIFRTGFLTEVGGCRIR